MPFSITLPDECKARLDEVAKAKNVDHEHIAELIIADALGANMQVTLSDSFRDTLRDFDKPINPMLDSGHIQDTLEATRGLLAVIGTANQGQDHWRECDTGVGIICGLIDDAILWHTGKFPERAE